MLLKPFYFRIKNQSKPAWTKDKVYYAMAYSEKKDSFIFINDINEFDEVGISQVIFVCFEMPEAKAVEPLPYAPDTTNVNAMPMGHVMTSQVKTMGNVSEPPKEDIKLPEPVTTKVEHRMMEIKKPTKKE